MADLEKNLALLKEACDNPKARLEHYLAKGKKVVGSFPVYTPEELVYASGMIPMGLWGGAKTQEESMSYLPPFACSIMHSNMELALTGAYKGLSAVIIPTLCDTFRCMTQNWRFGVKDIPMIPIVHAQNRTSPDAVEYMIEEYENVLLMLTTITGMMMSEDSLSKTIDIYNEHTMVMRKFSKTALDHLDVITPKVRHQVLKSAQFYDKKEHTGIVKEIIAELEERSKYEFKSHKVLLTGITCEPDEILDILETRGFAVVAADLAQEMRQYRTLIPDDTGSGLKRLALQWMNRHGCSL
ncbi:MAG: 2-hydroxyacyl-CoA dehydratase subunit D, partial [Lachnospiraceae bacterium]